MRINRPGTVAIVALALTLFAGSPTWGGPTYTGMLASDFSSGNTLGADGGLLGNNGWVEGEQPLVLRWNVSFDGSLWHYEYTFNELGLQGALSHMILEVSDSLQGSDILSASYAFEGPSGYNSGDPANPGIPGTIWAVKFDTVGAEDVAIVSFDSTRAPVWGDFYAKDGTMGGAAWNAGFTGSDTDPVAAAADGSIDSHLLVPDSAVIPPVPSPGAIVLSALGTVLIGWLRRKGLLA